MATLLDMGLLENVKIIFPLLLVFFVTFAVLEKTKVIGEENRSLNAVIAVCVSMMMLLSPNLIKVISIITPWVVFAVIAIMFFLVIFMFTGYKWSELIGDMNDEWGFAQWFLLVVFLIFIIGGLSTVYGQTMLPWSGEESGAQQSSGTQVTYTTEYVDENGTTVTAPMDKVRAAQAQGDLSTDTGQFSSNVGRIVFHPKILGMVLVLIIFSFAIRLLTSAE
jgi:hypothetical protein